MTRLAVGAGPPTGLPLAFLFAAPAWGCAAGLLLAADGAAALQDRWAPATLALVHALTLGVLGNAMAGALLQFLPAAAGVRLRGGTRAGLALFLLLNAGAIALVKGFHAMTPGALALGGLLCAAAFALLAGCVQPGLVGRLREALHRGIALAVVALLATTALGLGMVATLTGRPGLALLPWADVHAAWALTGGVLMLLASVSQVVLPMFQAVPPQDARRHTAWVAATLLVLLALPAMATHARGTAAAALAACAAGWAVSLLWRQMRTPLRRGSVLRFAWIGGGVAMLSAAAALAGGAPAPTIGAIVLALALPLPLASMLLEIVAFLGWIELQRRSPRGRRVPAVQVLLPPVQRACAIAAIAVAGVAVVLASVRPGLATAAGLLLAGAHAALLLVALGMPWRAHRFLAGRASP